MLNLGSAGIRYYAGSVIRSRIFQLQKRSETDRYIHATAFIAHQFFRIQDNLVDVFLSVMATFQTRASREHKDYLFEQRKAHNQQLKTVINELDTSVFNLTREIHILTDNIYLSAAQKVDQIRALLDQGKTESFEQLKDGLKQVEQPQIGHPIMEKHSLRLQSRLNLILKALVFKSVDKTDQLMEEIDYFKRRDGAITDKAPADFLDETDDTDNYDMIYNLHGT